MNEKLINPDKKKNIYKRINKIIKIWAVALWLNMISGDKPRISDNNFNNSTKTEIKLKDSKNFEISEENIIRLDFSDKTFYKRYKDKDFLSLKTITAKEYYRWNIRFNKWEDVVFFREPWLLEYWWKYESKWTIFKYKNWKKYIVSGLNNYYIYKINEIKFWGNSILWEIIPEVQYIIRRDKYLKDNSTLSKSDFIEFFSKKNLTEESWQKNTRNCFLIASFRALMESPNYETLIRTSVKYNKDKQIFEIKLPLWNPHGQIFLVHESDLVPQKNFYFNPQKANFPQIVPCQYVKWNNNKKKYIAQFNKDWTPIISKWPAYIKPMNAPKGLQALEVAYLKCYSWDSYFSFDRWKMMEGWFWDEALKILLWEDQSNELRLKMENLEDAQNFYNFLDNFNPYTCYATLNSNTSKWKTDTDWFFTKDSNVKIHYKHAYALIGTNPITRTIQIVNPWHLNEILEISYEQAFESFYRVKWAKTDFINWFKNLTFF